MGSPLPPSPSHSLLPHLSLALSYANTRNIFQMLFAFALHTIFAWRARCVPAFSHFSIFHVRFVVVADDTTHIHTLTHTHTVWHTHTHMLHTTLVFEALCCLHFHYFFYVIFSFLLFFFARCPTILTACQKEVVLYSMPRRTPPTPLATNPSMPAPLPLLLLLLPSKCLHSKLPMGQWTVCVCVLLRCAALLPLPAELLPLVFSSPL